MPEKTEIIIKMNGLIKTMIGMTEKTQIIFVMNFFW